MAVTSLGYVGVRTAAFEQWSEFGPEVLGFARGPDSSDDVLHFRMDDRRSRLVVSRGEREALDYLGWEMPDAAALDELVGQLERAGVGAKVGTHEDCSRRGVTHLVRSEDPSGNRLEFFTGARRINEPFRSPRPISKFVTGPLGVGHIVLNVADLPACVDFYQRVLGFKLSDQFGEILYFLRCNPRHHSIALANVGGDPRILHIMVEVASMTDVGLTFDVCLDREIQMSTLGLHANDLMTSFYLETPSGFEVEYGYNGMLVDDATWSPTVIDRPSIWGHRQLDPTNPPGERKFKRLAT